jgi:nucleotide-binding universal stress UspA family protein
MNEEIEIRKILLPVEFSERSRGAARYAEALASRFHAELVVLHVVPPPYLLYGGAGEGTAYAALPEVIADRTAAAKARLDAFVAQIPEGIRARPVLLEGDAAGAIVDFAHAERCDMVVMSTHGYGPFRRFLIGSVTAKVLHDVDCPVWTGPHLEAAPEWRDVQWRRIACALDLGPRSREVLAWAARMARQCGAALSLVHAVPGSTAALGGLTFDPEWGAELARMAREQMAQLQEGMPVCGDMHIETGDAAAAVSRAVEELGADLLVIGRSLHSGVMGRLRANAYAIIRESPCPVVSI